MPSIQQEYRQTIDTILRKPECRIDGRSNATSTKFARPRGV